MYADSLVRNHTTRYVVGGTLAMVAFGVAAAVPASPLRLDLVLSGLYVVAFASMLTSTMPPGAALLRNLTGEPPASKTTAGFVLFCIALVALFALSNPITMLVFTVFDLPPNHVDATDPAHPLVNASPVVSASALGAMVMMLLIQGGESVALRLVTRLVDAPWANSPASPDGWVKLVGTVEDPTPIAVDAQPAAFAMVTDTEEVPGSDPNIVVKRFENQGTFVVRAGDTRYEIDPARIHWAGATQHVLRSIAPSGNARAITTDYLPVGATVLVGGKLRPQARSAYRDVGFALQATDEDPVLVLRTDDPEALLAGYRKARQLFRASLVVIVVCAVIAGVAVALLSPSLPPLHVPAGSGD